MAITLINDKSIGRLELGGTVVTVDDGVMLLFPNIVEFIRHYYGTNFITGLEQTQAIVTGYYEGLVTIPKGQIHEPHQNIKFPLTPVEKKMPPSGQLKSIMRKLYK